LFASATPGDIGGKRAKQKLPTSRGQHSTCAARENCRRDLSDIPAGGRGSKKLYHTLSRQELGKVPILKKKGVPETRPYAPGTGSQNSETACRKKALGARGFRPARGNPAQKNSSETVKLKNGLEKMQTSCLPKLQERKPGASPPQGYKPQSLPAGKLRGSLGDFQAKQQGGAS